jgi:c-di-GMP-related signal transduction protein
LGVQLRFIARQPIFDQAMHVFGYELLFRSGFEDIARIADPDAASRDTMDMSVELGLDTLCNGHLAFINCTRETLLSECVQMLAPESIVLEILETVEPDEAVLARCKDLRMLGYKFALDDATTVERAKPFSGILDIIKVDFRDTTSERQKQIASCYLKNDICLLAEKVETRDELLAAQKMGYSYFQGFFFQRPQVVGAKEIPALQINYTRLLAATQALELDFHALDEIIKSEPSICYRLLRYLNSPLFGFKSRITSVRHALTLVGEHEIRKWISVAALVGVGVAKSPDLVVWALVRARFCELLGMRSPGREVGMFFLGLVSALPVLLDLPLEFIITRLPIVPEIQTALLGGRNHYRQMYDLVLAYEAGKWDTCAALAKSMYMGEDQVTNCYLQALEWAKRLTSSDCDSAPVMPPMAHITENRIGA